MMTRWRLSAFVRGPLFQEIETSSDVGGLPSNLGRAFPALFCPHQFSIGGSELVVSPFVDQLVATIARPGMPLMIVTEFDLQEAESPLDGLSQIEPDLEELLDRLSFAWTYPVAAIHAEIIDVTAPLMLGDERRLFVLAGYATPKFRAHIYSLELNVSANSSVMERADEPTKAALRWYAVALRGQPDAQRFMALWIALEILVKAANAAVHRPYRAPCGHNIEACPICSAPTSRSVGGAQMKGFLEEELGLDRSVAKRLWSTRQMMHGANKLTPDHLGRLPEDVATLWPVVQLVLARRLGLESDRLQAPVAAIGSTAVIGRRTIHDGDINPFAPTFDPPTGPLMRVEMPTLMVGSPG